MFSVGVLSVLVNPLWHPSVRKGRLLPANLDTVLTCRNLIFPCKHFVLLSSIFSALYVQDVSKGMNLISFLCRRTVR